MTEHPSEQKPLITRKDYMSGTPDASREVSDRAHRDYYAQFVTPETLRFVEVAFGMKTLKKLATEDPRHLNSDSVPVQQWYQVCTGHPQPDFNHGAGSPLVPLNRDLWKQAHGRMAFSPSDMICVAKEAARILVEKDND